MQSLLIGLLLEDGGRGMVRLACSLATLVVCGVCVVVIAPLALLASVTPTVGGGGPVAHVGSGVDGGRPGSAVPAAGSPIGDRPPSTSSNAAVDVARRYLGVPYVFGGSNPAIGLDCSGLVQLVFRQLGVSLPRTAQLQFNSTPRVAQADLQPGDLVFFARTYADPNDWITHVGIYLGGGLQINAPTEGQVVSIQPVFGGFWGAHYAGAGRVRTA